MLPPRGTPSNIRVHLIFLETTAIGLHFAADSMGLSSFKFVQWASKDASFLQQLAVQNRSRSSKVDNFGIYRKRVYDFLLVRHCDYGHMSCTVSEIRRLIG